MIECHVSDRFHNFSQNVVPLLTNLRIDILHPFVAVHVVCSTAVFVIFLVVTINYKCPPPAAPWIPSENIFMQVAIVVIDEEALRCLGSYD